MDKDLISIIIPVYNAESYMEETIQNVKKQTYQDWELILVNDFSKDRSVEIIEKYQSEKIFLLNLERNSGPAIARNEGIKEAKGKYICFLDADDLWDNQKLEKQLKFMQEKDCAFSFTGYQFMDKNGDKNGKIVKIPEQLTYEQALKNTTIFISTVMFDMTKLKKEDIQMPNVKIEDTATWWKVLRKGYIAYGLNETLSFYRRGENTRSANKLKAVKNAWKLYREQEKLGIFKSLYCFVCYIFHAIKRRI